jgi:hypothetical protein
MFIILYQLSEAPRGSGKLLCAFYLIKNQSVNLHGIVLVGKLSESTRGGDNMLAHFPD